MSTIFRIIAPVTCILGLTLASPAFSEQLQVSQQAHILWHIGAFILLYSHIAGGAIGIVSGFVASFSKKGQPLHRLSGKTFFYSMLVCYLIGALVSPFLEQGQRVNFTASVLALYLLLSGWHAAKTPVYKLGSGNYIGLIAATSITLAGITFSMMASNHPSGTVDGSPPQAFAVFIIIGLFAAAGEVHCIIRNQLSPPSRLIRHLWRMCSSFFIASGSFFMCQAKFLPAWLVNTGLAQLFALLPLIILIFFVAKISFANRTRSV